MREGEREMDIRLTAPLTEEDVRRLHAGDRVLLSGTVYTARDAAHLRMLDCIARGEPLPMPLEGQVIYYAGPTPTPPGRPVGSIGPTTSVRMDAATPTLLAHGLRGMIGKGLRGPAVVEAMKEHGAVYFAAIGGAGALLSSCIKKAEIVCYEDLGAEAVRRLEVENLPVVCVIDSEGNNLYETGRKAYLATL